MIVSKPAELIFERNFIFFGNEILVKEYDAKENKFGSMVSKIHTNLFIKGCQMSFGFKPNKGWYYKK